jgi:filamentous hemagglutinin
MRISFQLLKGRLAQSRLAITSNVNAANGLAGVGIVETGMHAPLFIAAGPKQRPLWQRAIATLVALALWVGPLQMVWQDAMSAAGQLGGTKTWLPRFEFGTAANAAPITDPAAPIRFQPTVTQSTGAGGGVPVINITQPNAAGISLNQFSQFNVDVVGLILNNSLVGGGSTLGGNVAANASLNGHAASQIINQVNSSGSASSIAGTIEVFGTKADVIIVNPNGIGCTGCSFLNTGRVVLSTGAPQFLSARGGAATSFDAAAALAYDVQGGHIQIEGVASGTGTPGTGIEASNAVVDLIADSIGLNAKVNAGAQLNVIAGRQLVSEAVPGQGEAGGTYSVAANGGTQAVATPSTYYAVDGTAFGAMNAGTIKVIGTADGFGVRVLGDTVASSGPLTISSNGDISGGNVYSPGDVRLSAKGNVTASQVTGYGAVNVNAAASSVPAAGHDVVIGKLTAATNAQVTGANVALGRTVVGGNLNVTTSGSVVTSSTGAVAGDMQVTAGTVYVNDGNWTAGHNLTINAAGVQNNLSAQLLGLGSTSITADDVANYGTLYGDTLRLRIAGTLDNTFGSLLAKTLLDVQTGVLISNYNGVLYAGDPNAAAGAPPSGDLTLSITGNAGSFDNTLGTIAANRNVSFSALNETFDPGAVTAGAFNANGVLTMNVGAFRNSANWSVPGADVFISGVNGVSNSGVMQTLGDLNLSSSAGTVSNTGALVAGQDVNVTGGFNNAANAVVHAERDVNLNGAGVNTGTVEALRNINLSGASYDNTGGVSQANGNITAALSGALTNTGGTLYGGQNVSINATSVINDQAAPVNIVSTSQQVSNFDLIANMYLGTYQYFQHSCFGDTCGDDLVTGDAFISTIFAQSVFGSMVHPENGTFDFATQDPVFEGLARTYTWTTGYLPTVDRTFLQQRAGAVGAILAGNNATITATSLSNLGGNISASNDLTANLSSLNNGASSKVILNSAGDTINQASLSTFFSKWLPFLAGLDPYNNLAPATTVVETSTAGALGLLQAGNDVSLNGNGNLVNSGNLLAGHNIAITLPGNFINQGAYASQLTLTPGCANGAYCSDPSSHIDTFAYSQTPNTVVAGGSLTVTAATIANDFGNLAAHGNVNLSANSLDNLAGTIQSMAGDVNITAPIVTNRVVAPVMTQTSYGSINPDFAQGCNAGGRYKGSECTAETANQASAAAVINGARDVNINGDSLSNYGSLITAGADANLNISGSISNTDAALNTYWQGHWVEETCWTCSDVDHNTNGVIANGNQAAAIQAGSVLAMATGDGVVNTGNLFGNDVNLSGNTLLNGIMDAYQPTAASTVAQQMIPVGPVGASVASSGAASTSAPLYAVSTPGSDGLSSFGPDLLVANLPLALRPDTNLFYYDAAAESNQIQQTALTQTGAGTFVNGVAWDSTNGLSINDQQKAILYNNTIDYATTNNIQLGQPLTPQQISSIDKPMLWYIEQSVPDPSCSRSATLCPNINALVPQVILPQNYAGTTAGGVISGNNVNLTFADSITNTGIIQATTLAATTNSLTNEQRSIDIGRQAYEVEGGWMEYTGTQLQPGGFMSAVNLDIQAQNITAVNDAFHVLNPDGTTDAVGTAALLATLQQTLGSNFMQITAQDNIQNHFIQDTSGPGMLGQVIAIAVAIALAVVTAGAGLAIVGAVTGTTIAAGSVAAVIAAGLQAAIVGTLSSMATQLITTGNLDFGQALQSGLVSGVIGGATAGVLGNAQGSATPTGEVAAGTESATTVVPPAGGIGQISQANWSAFVNNPMPYVTNTLIRSGISAGINSLVYGDSFATALKNGIVADAAAAGANAIGDLNMPSDDESSNLAANVVEHALLGCLAGAAGGGDCAGGAIGAAASAAISPDIIKAIDPTGAPLTKDQQALVAALAALSGGAAAGLAGADAVTGANSAANEALNNSEKDNHVAAEATFGGAFAAIWNGYSNLLKEGRSLLWQALTRQQNNPGPYDPAGDFSDPNHPTGGGATVVTGGAVAPLGTVICTPAGCIPVITPVVVPTSAGNVMYSNGSEDSTGSNNVEVNGSTPTDSGQTPGQRLAEAQKNHNSAVRGVAYDLSGQGANVQTEVTMDVPTDKGVVRARADAVVSGLPDGTLQVPDGYAATDLNGNVVTRIPLNSQGQAIIEVKTGAANLTPNQSVVYPGAQAGSAVGAGANAANTNFVGAIDPTFVIIIRPIVK